MENTATMQISKSDNDLLRSALVSHMKALVLADRQEDPQYDRAVELIDRLNSLGG